MAASWSTPCGRAASYIQVRFFEHPSLVNATCAQTIGVYVIHNGDEFCLDLMQLVIHQPGLAARLVPSA